MASIEMSTHPGSLRPTSAGQDFVVSSSKSLATDTSLSNPASLASSGTHDLNADPEIPVPHVALTKSGSKRALWVITSLGLIAAVTYGTSTWIQSSTAAGATAKANRLALFTACISFLDQSNIVNSTFCRTNSDASLDGLAKRAFNPPLLWDMDAFAEVLQIVQPAWQCKTLCGRERWERWHYPRDSNHVLSLPTSTGTKCLLKCFEPILVPFWKGRLFQIRLYRVFVVVFFVITAPPLFRDYYSISKPIATAVMFTCILWLSLILSMS
ncbi:hypothetical protein BCON_0099g00040 [Botryotinia convoluta]|uniref:Uncharacterized protein n=1 Tax=Botryotinia convoluta TaxID=54673 RepID=A0A4Z1I7Z7_9HELO|nr:hypothetical protein BCON_0099g00040 [Botryotinia convoluta]